MTTEPKEAPLDPSPNAPATLRPYDKPHAVDSVGRMGSHLIIRLWSIGHSDFEKVFIRTKAGAVSPVACTTLTYPRKDAESVAGPGAAGISIIAKGVVEAQGEQLEIIILTRAGLALSIKAVPEVLSFEQYLNGLAFDVQRAGHSLESLLLSDENELLYSVITSAWQEYVQSVKSLNYNFGSAHRSANFSIITVFYGKPELMTLYPFLAKIIDLGKDAEVIIVIQEASKFVHQVNYLESIFRRLDVNYQLLLFDHNVGFSAANNAALKIARAPVAVLVNPDIIIDDVGVYARIANVARSGSVVGATLLSDADEIMHRGLEINEQGVLRNGRISRIKRTFHTGRHATLDAITEGQILEATAVTGALIAVSQDTWRRVGGLSEEYVFAHFEDIDFCHTAQKLGVPVYVYDTKLIRHIESYGSRENEVLSSIKQINSAMFNKRNS